MTPHLNETQLYDLLSENSEMTANAAQLHLEACTRCQHEFSTLQQSLANFRLAATNIALLQTPVRPVVSTTIHRGFFAVPKFVWATGLASVLAVSALTFSTLHKQPVLSPSPVTTASSEQPVSDEALLQDIDSDLSTSVPPSLEPLDTTTTASEQTPTSTSN